jgi:hypothetical protein
VSASESGSASGSTPLLPEEYDSLIERLRETVNATIPRNATVLVISRGDDELLRIGPRRALHFPQDEFGRYPGYHPEDSKSAIELLESMRVRGGEYLLLPSTAFWWLDYYEAFRNHLERRYPAPVTSDDCMIFELSPTGVETAVPDADTGEVSAPAPSVQVAGPLDELLRALLPEDARIAVVAGGEEALPSCGHCSAVPDPAHAAGADFLVVPAGGEQSVPGGWTVVTRQRHLCTVYEPAGEPAPATNGASSPAARGPIRRLLRRLRRG